MTIPPKKIAWIVPKTYQTSESRVYKETNSLSNAGYYVKIFSMRQQNYFPEKEYENNIEIERIDFPLLKKLHLPLTKGIFILPIFTIKVLMKLIIYKPDLIYCMNFPSLHIGIILKNLLGCKCVYDSHDLYIDQIKRAGKSKRKRKRIMFFENFLAKKADIVIQTTRGRARKFKEYYGINPLIIRNKPLPPIKEFEPPEVIKQLIKNNKKIIGYVGSIHNHRGMEEMIEAASPIENVVIVLLGPAKDKWAKDFLEKNREKIIYIPPVNPENITTILKYFTVGISLIQNTGNSYYYSCPTKVYEFAVAGVPQIVSNFPEMSNLVLNNSIGPIGQVVDPSNIEQIRKSIISMLNSEKMYNQLKLNCINLRPQCLWANEEEKLVTAINSLWN
jgi:glycosyltransferase involved in cell wall biosynthesis